MKTGNLNFYHGWRVYGVNTLFKTLLFPFAALLLIFSCAISADDEKKAIVFGSVAMDIPAKMHKRLKPLTVYLSETLKRPVTLKLAPDMATAINDVATGDVDIAYLTPVAYLKSHAKGNTKLVTKTLTKNRDSFQLMIVVHNDSPIKRIEDLAGKSFAFGDKAALLQRAVVVGANMPLEKLGSYEFLGHYDNIVRGVLRHEFDAGILKDTKYFNWKNKGIRLLYSSPKLPPYNITVSKNVSEQLYIDIKHAFLSLDVAKPRDEIVIKSLSKTYDGFVATDDAEYDVVRRLIAPFSQ